MTKAPTSTEMSKGQSDNTNNATKKFDYTAIACLRVHIPTPRNSRVIKRTRIKKCVNKPPYIDNKPTATPSGEFINKFTNSIGNKYYISKIYLATTE